MKLKVATLLLLSLNVQAGNLDFNFSNPSFSGIGYSSHVLSIEQLQFQREQGVADDKTSAEKAAERKTRTKRTMEERGFHKILDLCHNFNGSLFPNYVNSSGLYRI